MYNENFVRMENGTGKMRRSGEAWNALAEFAKMFMDEYYPDNDDVHRSYNRFSDGENHHVRYRNQPRTASGRFKRVRFGHEDSGEMEKEEIGSALANAHGQEWLVEKAIEEDLEGINNLVLDIKGLEYVSSAGLRVLLKVRKMQEELLSQNVSIEINEIFEITGFVDILTIK